METEIDVIYKDNHLFVVNKPANVLTQPSGTDQDNLEDRAKQWIKHTYHKPGNVFLGAVHRLDKPVSGVVVFGCTSKALSRLSESIRDKLTKKRYIALVEGCPVHSEALLEHYMVHDDYIARIVDKHAPQAKLAKLTYRVIEKRGNVSVLEIDLDTGRYHQIRLQLSTIGCPILGDIKYGSKMMFGNRIALHQAMFQIPHPTTKELMTFEAPVPESFNL